MLKKRNPASAYSLLILSVLLWAVLSDAWGYSERFLPGMPDAWRKYLYAYLSRLIWVLPFLLLAVTQKQEGTIPPKQLFGFRFHWPSFLPALAGSTLYSLCGMLLTHRGWWMNPAYFIHWYRGSPFSGTAMLTQVISSLILGLIFGLLFQKSKSIWAPAIVHFWYDFSFVLLIG